MCHTAMVMAKRGFLQLVGRRSHRFHKGWLWSLSSLVVLVVTLIGIYQPIFICFNSW